MKVKTVALNTSDECIRSFRVTIKDNYNPDLAAKMVSRFIFETLVDRGARTLADIPNTDWDIAFETDNMEIPL